MNNLEDLIRNYKQEFEVEEPSPGHDFRFEDKLKKRFHRKDSFLIRYAAAIAASVIIFLTLSVFVYKTTTEGYKGAVETSQWVEFIEAEQYYSVQTEEAINELKETLAAQPKEVSSSLFSEINEMESSYKQLKEDLNNNPNDIRLMSAVVQYHQLKLSLINNLIERFTLYSNSKIKSNEKSNI